RRSREPRPGGAEGLGFAGPARTPSCRGAWIDAFGRVAWAEMVADVLDHVLHRGGGLPQRLEHVHGVAVGEDLASPRGEPVERARQPDGEPLHRAREGRRVLRLDDQVQVAALDGVVDDADPEALLCRAQGVLDGAPAAIAAKEANAEL